MEKKIYKYGRVYRSTYTYQLFGIKEANLRTMHKVFIIFFIFCPPHPTPAAYDHVIRQVHRFIFNYGTIYLTTNLYTPVGIAIPTREGEREKEVGFFFGKPAGNNMKRENLGKPKFLLIFPQIYLQFFPSFKKFLGPASLIDYNRLKAYMIDYRLKVSLID